MLVRIEVNEHLYQPVLGSLTEEFIDTFPKEISSGLPPIRDTHYGHRFGAGS